MAFRIQSVAPSGLSPRVRGNHHWANECRAYFGVYPRACGGTIEESRAQALEQGLSPRVRGNRYPVVSPDFSVGSIPARAGGTRFGDRREKPYQGLSPRVRGNLATSLTGLILVGSIPARAGEPLLRTAESGSYQVYPRACGGTATPVRVAVTREGLSPRVRGNPSHLSHSVSCHGSIPARAGEPS